MDSMTARRKVFSSLQLLEALSRTSAPAVEVTAAVEVRDHQRCVSHVTVATVLYCRIRGLSGDIKGVCKGLKGLIKDLKGRLRVL